MVIENLCPVCGYEMDDPPVDYNICPSCGTEFGVHDMNASIQELRSAWIEGGARWWSATDVQPPDWSPFAQLARISASAAIVGSGPVFTIDATSTSSASSMEITADSADLVWLQIADIQREVAA